MQLGSCHLWGDDIDLFREEIRLAGQLGFNFIGIGDSPAAWHDVYLSMGIAAEQAPNATIASFVTSPVGRHPLTAANTLSTLQDMYSGRIAMGLSTGGSNVLAMGQKPASQHQMRDYWQAFRNLLANKPAEYQGKPISPLRFAKPVPVFYSAFGPKALKLAGEMADGVILFTGEDLSLLDQRIASVKAAAKQCGRNPDSIEIIVTSFCAIRASREEAINDLKAFIVVNGMALRTPELLAAVPEQYRSALAELHRRYDPNEHVIPDGKNVCLMDKLGLTEFLSGFDTIAGSPEHVKSVLEGIKARGVSTFVANLPGHADRLGTLRRLADLKIDKLK